MAVNGIDDILAGFEALLPLTRRGWGRITDLYLNACDPGMRVATSDLTWDLAASADFAERLFVGDLIEYVWLDSDVPELVAVLSPG